MFPAVRIVLVSLVTIALAVGGCSAISVGTEDSPECGPPRKGVQTIDEAAELPLCEGDYDGGVLRVPSPADGDQLMKELIGHGLMADTVVDNFGWASSSICASLLGEATPRQIAPYAAKWFSKGEKAGALLTETQARSIVDLIVSQGWCRKT